MVSAQLPALLRPVNPAGLLRQVGDIAVVAERVAELLAEVAGLALSVPADGDTWM